MLRKKGINVTNADLQALLWYYEKDLWARLGYKAPKARPSDFAAAARKLVERTRRERKENTA
jgi:hypothetical protein